MISEKPSLYLKPEAYKTNVLYCQLPEGSIGNMTFARTSIATRVNKNGLIEEIATGTPRLDYPLINGVVQSCPDLLLEPTSINLITFSEDFSNGAWSKTGSSVVSGQTSPDGENNAYKLVEDTASSRHSIQDTENYTNTEDYTMSIFVKKNERSWIFIRYFSDNGVFVTSRAWFDINNGTIGTVNAGITATIREYSGGWYRCTATRTALATGTGFFLWSIADADNSSSYTGNGTSSIYIFGGQLEELSYATSYIKTTGSTETRATEECNTGGDATTFNSVEGVLYCEISALFDTLIKRAVSINDGSSDNRVDIRYSDISKTLEGFIVSGGFEQALFSTVLTEVTDNIKVALKYKLNEFSLWLNGVEINSDSSGSVPIGLNEFSFDVGGGANDFYGRCKEVRTYKTALTDAELTELTTI